MKYKLPHTIQNCIGEKITFLQLLPEADGDKLIVENFVRPGIGPVMHTHLLQDEVMTVVKGKIGYQLKGKPAQYAGAGETVAFLRGESHRFWNAGDDELHCKGYLKPANTIVFFLSSIYEAQNKSGSARPDLFDAAFLMRLYKSEYSMDELPSFVRKIIMPVAYHIGTILGKYKHFKDAPAPVR